jgi:hypothetical protein
MKYTRTVSIVPTGAVAPVGSLPMLACLLFSLLSFDANSLACRQTLTIEPFLFRQCAAHTTNNGGSALLTRGKKRPHRKLFSSLICLNAWLQPEIL